MTVNGIDHSQAAYAAHDIGEMLAAGDFDREQQGRAHKIALLVFDVLDIRIGLGNRGRDLGQYAGLVGHDDAQFNPVISADTGIPVDLEAALR